MPSIDSVTWRSPNYGPRSQPISAIVVHSCEGKPAGDEQQSSLPWLCDPASGVSCHYYITRAGVIYCLVDDQYRAWHAGAGTIGSDTDPNGVSLGIELEHRDNAAPYPQAQLVALGWLCQSKMVLYGIPTSRVVSHRATATPPGRKDDPTDWPEVDFRLWANSLTTPRASICHGLVLTNATTLNSLEDSVMAGLYDTIKVVTAWGIDGGWKLESRARLAAMTCTTVIRSHAGDPSSNKPYPHWEEIRDEFAPWYAIKPRAYYEIGNEPNLDGAADPAGYAYHLNRAIDICRQLYPRARLIAPALDVSRPNASQWLANPEFAAAIRRCDSIGVHAYAYVTFDDTGQFATIDRLYAPFRDKPWALTEYGINDKGTSDATKGQRYASMVKSLPAPYLLATFYHRDDKPANPNDTQYAIDLSGDRSYGQTWGHDS